jgi:hypothetical protein
VPLVLLMDDKGLQLRHEGLRLGERQPHVVGGRRCAR